MNTPLRVTFDTNTLADVVAAESSNGRTAQPTEPKYGRLIEPEFVQGFFGEPSSRSRIKNVDRTTVFGSTTTNTRFGPGVASDGNGATHITCAPNRRPGNLLINDKLIGFSPLFMLGLQGQIADDGQHEPLEFSIRDPSRKRKRLKRRANRLAIDRSPGLVDSKAHRRQLQFVAHIAQLIEHEALLPPGRRENVMDSRPGSGPARRSRKEGGPRFALARRFAEDPLLLALAPSPAYSGCRCGATMARRIRE